MTEKKLKEKYCCKCINSDCNFNCIAKQEAPFGTFVCNNGEMFELDYCFFNTKDLTLVNNNLEIE